MRVQHTFTAFIRLASFERQTAYADAKQYMGYGKDGAKSALRVDAVILVHMCGGKDGTVYNRKDVRIVVGKSIATNQQDEVACQ